MRGRGEWVGRGFGNKRFKDREEESSDGEES